MMAFRTALNPVASSSVLPIPGAVLWLDASDNSTVFSDAGVTPVSSNGQSVYQWNDKSGNGRHAQQTVAGSRPTWLSPPNGQNGLGCLSFNGTSSFLATLSTIGISGTLGRTVFTVQKDYTAGASVYPAVFYWGIASLRAYYAHVYNNGIAQIDIYGYGATFAISAGSYSILTSNLNASNQPRIRRNGGVWNTVSATTGTSNTTLYVGKSVTASGQYFSGPIAEVIVYPSNLSDANCLTVENYLKAKWGIP